LTECWKRGFILRLGQAATREVVIKVLEEKRAAE
jgi:hypothetical protein